jgi:hypothetical protein
MIKSVVHAGYREHLHYQYIIYNMHLYIRVYIHGWNNLSGTEMRVTGVSGRGVDYYIAKQESS